MERPCVKYGDCSFSRFGSIVWTDTDSHTQQTQMNAILPQLASMREKGTRQKAL